MCSELGWKSTANRWNLFITHLFSSKFQHWWYRFIISIVWQTWMPFGNDCNGQRWPKYSCSAPLTGKALGFARLTIPKWRTHSQRLLTFFSRLVYVIQSEGTHKSEIAHNSLPYYFGRVAADFRLASYDSRAELVFGGFRRAPNYKSNTIAIIYTCFMSLAIKFCRCTI